MAAPLSRWCFLPPLRGLRCCAGGEDISTSLPSTLARPPEEAEELGLLPRRACLACMTSPSLRGGLPARCEEERSWAWRFSPPGTATGFVAAPRLPGCNAWKVAAPPASEESKKGTRARSCKGKVDIQQNWCQEQPRLGQV